MGATITCGKSVAAFSDENGETIYILFEETFEKNCYPHKPHWSANAIGSIQVVMKRIFGMASCCEGGSLQGRGGDILPESYISGWMAALAKPHRYNAEMVVTLSIGNRFEQLPEEKREAVLEAIRLTGDAHGANELAAGRSIRRQLKSASVLSVFRNGDIGPWRLGINFQDHMGMCGSANELAYTPEKVRSPMILPSMAKSPIPQGEDLFELQSNGEWWSRGRMYETVGGFVESLWENELCYPGSFKSLIRTARSNASNAPVFGDDSIVLIDAENEGMHNYLREYLQKLAATLNGTLPMQIKLGEILAAISKSDEQNFGFKFHSLAEQGFIRIVASPSELIASQKEEEEKIPKPAIGMIVTYGGTKYRLTGPVGPRLGWYVERLSDGVVLRMKSAQVSEAMKCLAKEAKEAAQKAISQATADSSKVMQAVQQTLF